MEYVLTQMEKQLHLGRRALPHQISILDTVYWVSEAWKVVGNNTITKCFEKTGFSFPAGGGEQVTDGDDNINDEDDDIPLSIQKLTNDLFGFELSNLVKLDQEVNTFDNNTTDWDFPVQHILENEVSDECMDDPDDEEQCISDIPTISDAYSFLDKLKVFAQHKGNAYLLENVMSPCGIVK